MQAWVSARSVRALGNLKRGDAMSFGGSAVGLRGLSSPSVEQRSQTLSVKGQRVKI